MDEFLPGNERNSMRYPPFPGLRRAMRVRYTFDKRHILPLNKDFGLALAHSMDKPRFDALLDVYAMHVHSLFSDRGPKCIIVHFPEEVANLSIENQALTSQERARLRRLSDEDQNTQISLFDLPDE